MISTYNIILYYSCAMINALLQGLNGIHAAAQACYISATTRSLLSQGNTCNVTVLTLLEVSLTNTQEAGSSLY